MTPLLRPKADDIFEALCDHNRRMILLLVKAEAVETTTDVTFWVDRDASATELELVHSHLPKLADVGYVDWDRRTGELSKGPHFDEVEPFLELLETHAERYPDDWP